MIHLLQHREKRFPLLRRHPCERLRLQLLKHADDLFCQFRALRGQKNIKGTAVSMFDMLPLK